jgi:chromosome segregation ATPase
MSAEIRRILGIDQRYDKKSAEFLSAAIAKQQNDEFDYVKFKQSVNAMSDLKLNEQTAFKSAFATATTIGVTKSALVNSAKHYLSILMNEKSQFDAALNNQVKEKVASKRDQVLKLQQGIEEMKAQIAVLERRIAEAQQKIDSADDTVQKAKQKIQNTKDKFEQTFDAFVQIIRSDIERISEHL